MFQRNRIPFHRKIAILKVALDEGDLQTEKE
jgi:hypothetical protein